MPTPVISPYAKKGYVDSTSDDPAPILALIEHRWNLPALGDRDAKAADLSLTFNP